ncbi:MAG: hypothetical protein ACON41_07535 [Parvibaculales bacterium]
MAFKSGTGLVNFLQNQRETARPGSLFLFIVALLFLLFQSVQLPGLWGVSAMPNFLLIIVFFCSVLGEDRLGHMQIFGLGLMQDLLMATPLGLWGGVLLLMHLYTRSQATILVAGSFMTNWISFALVSLAAYAIVYFGVSLQHDFYFNFSLILIPYIATLAVFPVMTKLLDFLELRLSRIGIGG